MCQLSTAMGKVFRGPNQFPFLALLPAEEWANLLMDEVGAGSVIIAAIKSCMHESSVIGDSNTPPLSLPKYHIVDNFSEH